MNQTLPTIVFFGSGPVAAQSLKLLTQHATIEAIITKPSTLGEMQAAAPGIPVHTVTNKSELSAHMRDKTYTSKLGVLIDFGIIVSQDVIDYFYFGIINSHFSLLPEHRGADPITFSILSGQKNTGVSLMLLVQAMDEGAIIAYDSLSIQSTETTATLTAKLIQLSDVLLRTYITQYISGSRVPITQEAACLEHGHQLSYSRKLTKEDGRIDWFKPAKVIEREIRAFITWPKSYTVLADKDVIITSSHVVCVDGDPGQVIVRGKQIIIYCGEDALCLDTIKPAGKKEMSSEAFIAGHPQLRS